MQQPVATNQLRSLYASVWQSHQPASHHAAVQCVTV